MCLFCDFERCQGLHQVPIVAGSSKFMQIVKSFFVLRTQDAPNFGGTNKAGYDRQSGHSGNTWTCENETVGVKVNKNPEANRFE